MLHCFLCKCMDSFNQNILSNKSYTWHLADKNVTWCIILSSVDRTSAIDIPFKRKAFENRDRTLATVLNDILTPNQSTI